LRLNDIIGAGHSVNASYVMSLTVVLKRSSFGSTKKNLGLGVSWGLKVAARFWTANNLFAFCRDALLIGDGGRIEAGLGCCDFVA